MRQVYFLVSFLVLFSLENFTNVESIEAGVFFV